MALIAASACCIPSAPIARRSEVAAQDAPASWGYEPSRDLGTLFHDVQLSGLFPDGKTFVDARALDEPARIATRYASARHTVGFSIATFVAANFARAPEAPTPIGGNASMSMEDHIRALWPSLTRAADRPDARATLLPLPKPYVVPGGRFREAYYWDSYFTMLGLLESGRIDLIEHMLDNFAYLVRTYGRIPNGNRTYYLSRSQPPYFAAMVARYAQATSDVQALRYLDAIEAEHAFWMDGADRIAPGEAHRRAVRLPNGAILNRYWDDRSDPRPESHRVDFELAASSRPAERAALHRNVRAAAESGWDFSSRWMRDPADLRTLETTELAPIDLNSLLCAAERTIAMLRRTRGRPEDAATAERFAAQAETRRRTLTDAAFDPHSGFFYDVRFRTGERVTDRPTLAAASPLYFGLATAEQGRQVAERLQREFLEPGGFVTSRIASGQQWDAPNGWPPLQWLAIEGVRRYGRPDVSRDGRTRWLSLSRRVYAATGKMTEKYDVRDLDRRAGGGEYPTQDGFGWSNGVALALAAREGNAFPLPATR